jgi:hypothetical protein
MTATGIPLNTSNPLHPDETSHRREQALISFFSASDRIVGSEANYQVLLACALEEHFPGLVRREHKIPGSGVGAIDLVVLNTHSSPLAVFEIKGGAWNERNSLKDSFTAGGSCTDMRKIEKIPLEPLMRWIVAVDAVELGQSLNYRLQTRTTEETSARGLNFAYHAHGSSSCIIAHAGRPATYARVPPLPPSNRHPPTVEELFGQQQLQSVLGPCHRSLATEHDVVTCIYRNLVSVGFSRKQIGLETYFGFAPGRMAEKPDMCIFDPNIDGHFNLYPNGDRTRSYDDLKLESIQLMIEFKGGTTLLKSGKKSLMKHYLADIEKLSKWRNLLRAEGARRGISNHALDFMFIGVDLRPTPLDHETIKELTAFATTHHVAMRYVHLKT